MFSRVSPYACGSADVRVYVRLKKETTKEGKTPRRQRRGALTVRTCAPRAARVRVCLKRNIFLYYYSHRAYFSYPPTCIPGGWVRSFSLSVFFCLSFRNASLSLARFLSSPPRNNGKDSTPNARSSLFTRASPREIAWRAQQRAREPRKRSASIKRSPSLAPPLVSPLSFSFSFYDRAAIAAPALT